MAAVRIGRGTGSAVVVPGDGVLVLVDLGSAVPGDVTFPVRIYVLGGVTLKLTKGVVLFGSPNMTVNGTLLVEGTAVEPVVFTGAKGESPGEWCAISLGAGSGASVIEYAEIKYGGACGTGAIAIENGISPMIRSARARISPSSSSV